MAELSVSAYTFADKCHEGQVRKYTGTLYILHPVRIVQRLIYFGCSEAMIAAGYLHDVIEDCNVAPITLLEMFGPEVESLVVQLTNTSKHLSPNLNRARRKQIDRERLAGVSREAKFIKLLDRIDNLNEMELADKEFKKVYCDESELLLAESLKGTNEKLEEELAHAISNLRWTINPPF